MSTVPLRPSWPLRPPRSQPELDLAAAVERAAAASVATLPDRRGEGTVTFQRLRDLTAVEERIWGVARAGAPGFEAEVGTASDALPDAQSGFDAHQPVALSKSLAAGFRVRARGAERWLPELGELHNDIVRGWRCRVAVDAVMWQQSIQLEPVAFDTIVVALAGDVVTEIDGVGASLRAGTGRRVPPGTAPTLISAARGVVAQLVLRDFDAAASLEHFRAMAGHHPLMRADLPTDGVLVPRSYAGSLMDTPELLAATALELFDAIDPDDARSWWEARLTLVPEAPPAPGALRSLRPVLPVPPAFLADSAVASEPGVDLVVATGGFGVPLTADQLGRLTELVRGSEPVEADGRLLALVGEAGLLRSAP